MRNDFVQRGYPKKLLNNPKTVKDQLYFKAQQTLLIAYFPGIYKINSIVKKVIKNSLRNPKITADQMISEGIQSC